MASVEQEPHRLSEGEYLALIGRIQQVVARTIPPRANVLVVSKGDHRLLELGGRSAGHFPQEPDGSYPGYHPADSAAAIGLLEELHRSGAEYLLLPATAAWWLRHYGELAGHLESRYRQIANEPDTCVIFSLQEGAAQDAGTARDLSAAQHDQGVRQLRELLHSLLPADAVVGVVAAGDPALLDLGFAETLRFAAAEGAADGPASLERSTLLAGLQELAAAGVDYLVVPDLVADSLEGHDTVVSELEQSCRLVAQRQHIGSLFALERNRNGAWRD
jgi:hypothetical protein